MSKSKKLNVQGNEITIIENKDKEYISLTDMLKAKDGDFFISDWLRNRNTVEYLGIWESVYNPSFNYGEFAIIKSQAGLNSYKISVKEWVEKTNAHGYHVQSASTQNVNGSQRLDVFKSVGHKLIHFCHILIFGLSLLSLLQK